MKQLLPLCYAALLAPSLAFGAVIVDDSWADGGRNNGADPLDTDWWSSTASNAIEVGVGFLGLVSGSSGRGIHGTFDAQTLAIGDTLTATFAFTTPVTVGTDKGAAFRAGFFDTTGKPGLAANISASSGSPNAIYNNLAGYMMDLDVNTSTNDVSIRERSAPLSGQLLATTGDYTILGSGGSSYTFAASTAYSAVFSITRTGADSLDLTGSLFQGATELSTHTASDLSGIADTFGMLAFHVGSATFGSSSTVGAADNGIDFTNVKIEFIPAPIPEPSSIALLAGGLLVLGQTLRRRRQS